MDSRIALILLTWAASAVAACAAFVARATFRMDAPCRPCAARALDMAIFAAVMAEAALVAFAVIHVMSVL